MLGCKEERSGVVCACFAQWMSWISVTLHATPWQEGLGLGRGGGLQGGREGWVI